MRGGMEQQGTVYPEGYLVQHSESVRYFQVEL